MQTPQTWHIMNMWVQDWAVPNTEVLSHLCFTPAAQDLYICSHSIQLLCRIQFGLDPAEWVEAAWSWLYPQPWNLENTLDYFTILRKHRENKFISRWKHIWFYPHLNPQPSACCGWETFIIPIMAKAASNLWWSLKYTKSVESYEIYTIEAYYL